MSLMPLYFITENKNKFEEVKSVIPDIEHLDMELPEIQEIDPKKIIETKLKEALNHKTGEFRGWICHNCNTALGLVNDDIQTLGLMLLYIKK